MSGPYKWSTINGFHWSYMEEVKSVVKEHVPKSGTTVKSKIQWDNTRETGMDARDPRQAATQWPCYGEHTPQAGLNRYGKWTECRCCGLRLHYVPAINAPGQTTHVDLPQNVMLALERLRSTTPDPNEIKAQMVKAPLRLNSPCKDGWLEDNRFLLK